jgi:CubicO group peptidase (beta-lactamase class C family)
MNPSLALITLLLVLVSLIPSRAADDGRSALPRSTPEAQGVASARVLAFIEAIDQEDTMNSFMLVRHGCVIAEGWWSPYEAGCNHTLYSLSKSFTATAVGIAIGEDRLSIDDEVLKFFPDDAPADPSANLKAMRVRDLLCMSTGHQDGPSPEANKVSAKTFLAFPVPNKPGTHFLYNTAAAFMLSAIVQKQTGQSVLDYLRPRLFEPLGITQPMWATNFQGIPLGGNGLRLRTEDIAKFGQLYIQKGKWKGKQLIPASWVEAATARQTSNGSDPKSDFEQGYGYQFWRGRHGAYYGIGWSGQFCLVLPEQDAVIAITSAIPDGKLVFSLIWEHLLPAFHPRALAREAAACKALQARLTNLSLRRAQGGLASPLVAKIVGRKYVFPPNEQKLESISILSNTSDIGLTLVTREAGIEHRLNLGQGIWSRGHGVVATLGDEPLATMATWMSEDTLVVKVCVVETPLCLTYKLRFDGDRLIRDWQPNVGFDGANQQQLIGTAQ